MTPDEKTGASEKAEQPGKQLDWFWHLLAVVCLLGLSCWIYAPTVDAGFLSVDDPDYVQNNPWIEDVTTAKLKHILTTPYQANYAPANLLSYALDVVIAHGKNAKAIHLSNVAWHAFVVLAVYLLAFILRGEIVTASAAALLFLLHPAHVEVVAWISSRKDLIATAFAVLSMTCYLLWRRQARPHPGWFAASLICFLVAIAGKQSVILLPALFLVWDVFVEKRIRWQIIFEKLPFVAVAAFFGWMTWRAQPSTNQAWRPLVLALTEIENLKILAGASEFVMYRQLPDFSSGPASVKVGWIAAAALAWILPLAIFGKRQPVRLFLCWWILVSMIPPALLNFIVPVTDRYLFLPSVGLCILLADLAAATATGFRRGWVVALVAVIGLALFWGNITWSYAQDWTDPRSVWYGAHLKTKNPQVSQFLGEGYHNAGDRVGNFVKRAAPLEVEPELRLAAKMVEAPQLEALRAEWTTQGQPNTNSIAYRDKLWALAREQYQEAAAHRGTLSMPNLYMNRGRLLVSQEKYEQAIPEFQTALAFARSSTYFVIREETSTHALRAIAVAYWNMRQYRPAYDWMFKARETQRKSHMVWVPTLDKELEQLRALAGIPEPEQ